MARNSVSKRASSNPSPMYLPVTRIVRDSFSGTEARAAAVARRCFPHAALQIEKLRQRFNVSPEVFFEPRPKSAG